MLLTAWRHRFFSPSNTESIIYWRHIPLADPCGLTYVAVASGEDLLSGMSSFAHQVGRFSVVV
jgi:hypothetical protein